MHVSPPPADRTDGDANIRDEKMIPSNEYNIAGGIAYQLKKWTVLGHVAVMRTLETIYFVWADHIL